MGCYCGSGNPYAVCCQPYHDGTPAPTAEHLMQSRFGSFYLKNVDYIIATTVPSQQDRLDKSALQAWADGMNWTRLDVISHNKIGKRHAQVHFKAYFDNGDGEQVHDELSAFVKIGERWYFLDPTVPVMLTNKQPCLCGSGEKFKACCGKFLL
ncbi:YchJ family protein [Moraxella bovis]|uniref:YchJ family protein n=1 Tax=Moraxella bovis TaxID=476 RepID=UPI0022265012|nr:YchJ family protein [Moraxella bovis]UYZ69299.1 YchJ family protein [Moraxella bovis]UYZ71670.1 YchJ family protein [Moraxella bovis]UYZ72414.1 YchJ family protein [Moraxella bovis]UZA14968.1 YchJ family protein [Moraxella bovis]UZA26673.1 YchJ family protein [Moraxella bovis]